MLSSDAAIAHLLKDKLIQDEILDIGVVESAAPATLLMSVRKSGRSPEPDEMTVMGTTVNVSYGERGTAHLDHCLWPGTRCRLPSVLGCTHPLMGLVGCDNLFDLIFEHHKGFEKVKEERNRIV